jgi:DNA helicase-2/ATP-dependent DNA helicase PcrA
MFDLNTEYTKAKRALFDKVYAERLNPEQCRAVFTVKGPLLVLAGAGSGKTTVLVNRIAYLIRYGNAYFSETVPDTVTEETVEALRDALDLPAKDIEDILPEFITEPCPPWNVLAITFTNKAANEMKERLSAELGDKGISDSVWAGTFHSVCLRILRKYGELVGYRAGFSIYDADDSKRMIINCMKELEIDEKRLSPKVVQTAISREKDNLRTSDEMEDTYDPRSRDIQRIYELYTKKLMENNAVDFDDIIMKTVTLLNNYADVREYYQRKFRYVLVDEYQDTNKAQFVLTSILAGGENNIMVVGDDDQSIYRFRGATIENILNFDKTYTSATVVKLEQNYRSTETILDAANAIIHRNDDRHEKSLWCDKGRGELITLRELYDQNEEGRYIVDKISSGVRNQGRKYSDYAILYRVN